MAKKKGGGGANWMDTYGDMVTLLLCFFVLLYSMSTISTDKFRAIVMSFNPNAVFDPTEIVGGNDGPSADPMPSDPADDPGMEEEQAAIEQALMDLYEQLKQYLEQSQSAAQIELSRGDGYVFISFNEAVFFRPNDWELLPAGQVILKDIAEIMNKAAEHIDEVVIMGHTAQADMNRPNYTLQDRRIAGERAIVATAYIQDNAPDIKPARIIGEFFGMHRPIAPNDSEAGKKINRRVEILISGKNVLSQMGDSIQKYESIAGEIVN